MTTRLVACGQLVSVPVGTLDDVTSKLADLPGESVMVATG
jgi:hypothetical protein